MNPLSLPRWNQSTKRPEPKAPQETFSILDPEAKAHIIIEVRNMRGITPRKYKVGYNQGQHLNYYLGRLKLRRAASYCAVYDLSNKTKGRLRKTYIPPETAHIVLGSAMLSQHQRSSVDAQRMSVRMGGGAKVVEVTK